MARSAPRCLLGCLLVAVVVAASAAACEPAEIVTGSDAGTAAGGSLPYDAGNGGNAPGGGGGGGPGPDAGTSTLRLGLTPNPSSAGGGMPTEAETLQARLTTYAVGVRAALVERTWAELAEPGAMDGLADEVAELRADDLAVVLTLLFVDRAADHRPAALADGAWNDEQSSAAMAAVIDELLTAVGDELHALVLGRETDVYLAEHPDEAPGLVQLLGDAVLAAEAFADGELPSGVGLSFVGLSPPAAYGQLLELGQLAVWSYQPGLGADQLPNDTSAAKDLDTMIDLAGDKPILLIATGFSSAEALGATLDGQQQFLDSLWSALAPRRHHFDVVNVHELHDRDGAACARLAAGRGEPPDGPYAQYACRCGMREVDGSAKPAWLSFVRGAAAFASP